MMDGWMDGWMDCVGPHPTPTKFECWNLGKFNHLGTSTQLLQGSPGRSRIWHLSERAPNFHEGFYTSLSSGSWSYPSGVFN